jgi:hypothetical protein
LRYLIAAALALLVLPSQAFAEFSFQNQSSFIDEDKLMHVFGEVRNDSGEPVKDVVVRASFYDKDGGPLGQYQRQAELRVINPGESSPFEIIYLDSKTSGTVANYTLAATGNTTEAKEKSLKIVSSNSRLDLLGVYYINALVTNEGKETTTNSILIATLYDKDGKVIAIGKALAEVGGPDISDVPPQSSAAFSVVVAEKLQTYKTASYSLVTDSDQYVSDVVFLQASGPGLRGGTGNSTSGCLIATAAFGSELTPQVQQLRVFRDGIALQTFAGSSFMSVFNAWYYSFSPAVADYERGQPWLQTAVKASIYPLLGILGASTFVYDALAFNNELAIVAAGLTASSLIGALYFAPVAAVVGIAGKKKRWDFAQAKYVLAGSWVAGASAVAAAELAQAPDAMMFGTSLLVLASISTVVIGVARLVSDRKPLNPA